MESQSNALKRPSSLNTPSKSRKPPKVRIHQKDQLEDFEKKDAINNFADLSKDHCPAGYTCHKTENRVIFYNLFFDETNEFPVVHEAIKIDSNLHVKLQIYGNPVPLPLWFTEGQNAKLASISMLENFPNYLQALIGNKPTLMEELQRRQHYKPQSRPPYSAEMIRFALLVRYTSAQAYKILLQHFPFPSFSLLSKLKSSNVDAIKAAQLLREKDTISDDIVLMADEMHLQKCIQYSGGDYVDADADENLYKGIVVFMIQGLKHTVPLVVKASEVSVSGQWLASNLSDCIESLGNAGFNVCGIVTDNHSANVSAFNHLQKMFPSSSGDVLCMQHPQNASKTSCFLILSIW